MKSENIKDKELIPAKKRTSIHDSRRERIVIGFEMSRKEGFKKEMD